MKLFGVTIGAKKENKLLAIIAKKQEMIKEIEDGIEEACDEIAERDIVIMSLEDEKKKYKEAIEEGKLMATMLKGGNK